MKFWTRCFVIFLYVALCQAIVEETSSPTITPAWLEEDCDLIACVIQFMTLYGCECWELESCDDLLLPEECDLCANVAEEACSVHHESQQFDHPSGMPSPTPTASFPTGIPSVNPTMTPSTSHPSTSPTSKPTTAPTSSPTLIPEEHVAEAINSWDSSYDNSTMRRKLALTQELEDHNDGDEKSNPSVYILVAIGSCILLGFMALALRLYVNRSKAEAISSDNMQSENMISVSNLA